MFHIILSRLRLDRDFFKIMRMFDFKFVFVIIVRRVEFCMIFKIIDLNDRESTLHISVIGNDLKIEVVV